MGKKKNKNKKRTRKQNKKQIKDNYSFKEMDMTFKGAHDFQQLYLLAKEFGFREPKFEEAFQQFEESYNQYKVLKIIPDRFNHFFAKKGWIAFENLNFPLMEKCVKLAEQGNPNEAEDALIEYFTNREQVNFLANRLMALKEFQPRRTLMLNALEDHFSGRYHASVPLFLMMIDGFVNDFEHIGFFAENVELTVWDTIAAHDSGLGAITKIFGKSRKKTTDEEVELPYRNGILHGRDLGYANVKVSSKALSTLLALRDWADAIKAGKKGIDKEFVPPSFEETMTQVASSLEQYQENQKQKEHMNNWVKRDLTVGEDLPEKGEVSDYSENTPERALIEFHYYLLEKNYGKMAKMVSKHFTKDKTVGKLAGELREIFIGKKLVGFKLVNVYDNAPAISEIEMLLEFEREEEHTIYEIVHKFRLSYEDENGETVVRGYKEAEWRIMMLSLQELEYSHIRKGS
ncbi:hypothetical protein [Alkalihalobacillus sp. BA299]|uniref:hypothetical protein n=1 Tax=Alkalihalobacillus sp. BA299 TaxID=2815938 RepID=UPI001ADBD0E2|nr:hypothetical protein [Alkalihalobacillus sp. BA299]